VSERELIKNLKHLEDSWNGLQLIERYACEINFMVHKVFS